MVTIFFLGACKLHGMVLDFGVTESLFCVRGGGKYALFLSLLNEVSLLGGGGWDRVPCWVARVGRIPCSCHVQLHNLAAKVFVSSPLSLNVHDTTSPKNSSQTLLAVT